MRERQMRLELDKEYKPEDLWQRFPERTQQQVIEVYARLLARAAKQSDAVCDRDKGERK